MPSIKRRKRTMTKQVYSADGKSTTKKRRFQATNQLGPDEEEGPVVTGRNNIGDLCSEQEDSGQSTISKKSTQKSRRKRAKLSEDERRQRNEAKFETLVNSWFGKFRSMVRCYLERFRTPPDTENKKSLCLDCGRHFSLESPLHNCGSSLFVICDKDGVFPLKTASNATAAKIHMRFSDEHYNDCNGGHTPESFVVFDAKGRERLCMVDLCSLDSDIAVSLIRHNLWPATPDRPGVAMEIPLMEQLYAFNVGKRTALQCMCEGLQIFAEVTAAKQAEPKFSGLLSIFRDDSLPDYLRGLKIVELEEVMKHRCVACATDNGKVCICMDGNFQMVQKLKSGQSSNIQLTSDFLCDQEEVDKVAEEYVNQREPRKKEAAVACANFIAGDSAVQSSRNKGLAVKGVFGSCCRHMFPLLFLDMKFGERYCYPAYIMRKLAERFDSGVELHLQYDIACKLKTHFQINNMADLLDRYNLWVPEFHKYAHGTKCQLEFSVWLNGGVGLSDGEAMERFWSLFQQAIKCMKEMSGLNRKAYFDSALFFIGKQANDTQEKWLESQFIKAEKFRAGAGADIIEHLKAIGCHPDDYSSEEAINKLVDKWDADVREDLEIAETRNKQKKPTWRMTYVIHLERMATLKSKIKKLTRENKQGTQQYKKLAKEERGLETELTKFESDHDVEDRWQIGDGFFQGAKDDLQLFYLKPIIQRLFDLVVARKRLLDHCQNLSVGQNPHKVFRGKVKAKTKSVNSVLVQYNKTEKPSNLQLPDILTFDDVKEPDCSTWLSIQLEIGTAGKSSIDPQRVPKLEVIKLQRKKMASIEDKEMIKVERSWIHHMRFRSAAGRLIVRLTPNFAGKCDII